MDANVRTVIQECSKASAEGRISFGEVVMKLVGVGVERYHVDYVRRDTTYYLPNGDVEIVEGHDYGVAPAPTFSATGVEAAVRGAQAGTLKYRAFSQQALEAGCVGYVASMAGKRVVYYGRSGDSHVEWFPGAKP
jgi:uncharacterized protein YbcV (DUF1398 family)